jgi:hypothetical protein
VNKIKVSILFFALFFIAGYAQAENILFSPLTAIPSPFSLPVMNIS